MPAFGVYPIADALPASHNEISSTYEGRHVTVLAQELLTSAGSGTATKGLPCVFGLTGLQAVGVCMTSGTGTDLIAVDTEGIWNLDVDAEDDGGAGSAVAGGDLLYIDVTTGVLSKINNIATQIPFGYALGIITANLTERIAVKVHFDPPELNGGEKIFSTVGEDEYGWAFRGIVTDSHSDQGIGGSVESLLEGTADGRLTGWKSWIYLMSGAASMAGQEVTPLATGLYTVDADVNLRGIFAGEHQAILTGAPAFLYAWRFNTTQTVTALIQAANYMSVGYIPGVSGQGVVGVIPFVDQSEAGVGIGYIDLHAAYA